MPRVKWTSERRKRFAATIARKRLEKRMQRPVLVAGYKDTKRVEPVSKGELRDMTSLRSIVDYWRERGADKIVIDV